MENSATNKFVQATTSSDELRHSIYKNMTPAEKLVVAGQLYFSALALKKAHYERLHPDWSSKKIEQQTKEWMLYART